MDCRFYSNSRLLIGFLVVLLSGSVLLIGFGGISKAFAARVGSPHAVPSTSATQSTKSDVASNPGSARPSNRSRQKRLWSASVPDQAYKTVISEHTAVDLQAAKRRNNSYRTKRRSMRSPNRLSSPQRQLRLLRLYNASYMLSAQ